MSSPSFTAVVTGGRKLAGTDDWTPPPGARYWWPEDTEAPADPQTLREEDGWRELGYTTDDGNLETAGFLCAAEFPELYHAAPPSFPTKDACKRHSEHLLAMFMRKQLGDDWAPCNGCPAGLADRIREALASNALRFHYDLSDWHRLRSEERVAMAVMAPGRLDAALLAGTFA
jgi:hypothetical protein